MPRLATYKELRDEVMSFSQARRTWTAASTSGAMEVDAIKGSSKGKGGKGRGKGGRGRKGNDEASSAAGNTTPGKDCHY
eukprot:1302221-Lingulodinium_polyedra.AAC.1